MLSFTKRVRSPEMEERHFNNLKLALQDPKTKIESRVEKDAIVFTLQSEDGRVHKLNYQVDSPSRRRITLVRKETPPESSGYKKRSFVPSRS